MYDRLFQARGFTRILAYLRFRAREIKSSELRRLAHVSISPRPTPGKVNFPKTSWHLSNGFSSLAKGLWRSANDASSLAKDTLSSARDILQISEGFSGLSNGFWGLAKGKPGFPSQKTRFLMFF
jgi:hypothetical protein